MIARTPGPWSLEPIGNLDFRAPEHAAGDLCIIATSRVCPGIVWGNGAEGSANAAYIVTACNAHDELVAALESVYATLSEDSAWEGSDTLADIEAALAQVQP